MVFPSIEDLEQKYRDSIIKRDAFKKISGYDPNKLGSVSPTLVEMMIKEFYKLGEIDNQLIEEAISFAVVRKAKSEYNFMAHQGVYNVSELENPEFFAYALFKGVFTDDELSKINFGSGESVDSFNRKYGLENLLGGLRKKLLDVE